MNIDTETIRVPHLTFMNVLSLIYMLHIDWLYNLP